MRGLDRLVSDT